MGESAPPFVWLFNQRFGHVRHWVHRTIAQSRRDRHKNLTYDFDSAHSDFESHITALNRAVVNNMFASPPAAITLPPPPLPQDNDPILEQQCQAALAVLEDGVTLPVAEYRVMKFCLANARGSARMTDWLHQRMARVLGVSRSVVSRLYGLASRRLIDAAGLRSVYLRRKGIATSPGRRQFRGRLTSEEILAVIAHPRATSLDLAWAIGVTDVTVKQLRRRFRGMSVGEVRAALAQQA